MKKQLMIAVLAAAGLAACGEERAVQTSAPSGNPSAAPAQPVQAAAPSAPAPQVVAQEEKKDEPKFEPEGKGDFVKPQDEDQKGEGGKKAD